MDKRLVLNVYDDGSISVKPATTWLELVSFVNTMNMILNQCQQARLESLHNQCQAAHVAYRTQYEAANSMHYQWTSSQGEDEIDGLSELQAAVMSVKP